jgi:translation initiation factor 2 beta subunit (eIF-2beta)/eIF-5
MSISEHMEELKHLIRTLINDVQEIKNEVKEARNDINILKLEVRKLKENEEKNNRIDKKFIEKEITRIGKKHIERKNIIIETGSMDDEFRKNILPKIIEEEESREKILGKQKIEENQDKEDE